MVSPDCRGGAASANRHDRATCDEPACAIDCRCHDDDAIPSANGCCASDGDHAIGFDGATCCADAVRHPPNDCVGGVDRAIDCDRCVHGPANGSDCSCVCDRPTDCVLDDDRGSDSGDATIRPRICSVQPPPIGRLPPAVLRLLLAQTSPVRPSCRPQWIPLP